MGGRRGQGRPDAQSTGRSVRLSHNGMDLPPAGCGVGQGPTAGLAHTVLALEPQTGWACGWEGGGTKALVPGGSVPIHAAQCLAGP